MRKVLQNKGITLIALVITIIVLLILAGITIVLTIGQNGILSRTQESGLEYKEQEAKEKLELVLLDLQTDKRVDANYNENEYIDARIREKEISINGDIAIVDGWQFQIDRTVPKIIGDLGKGTEIQQIALTSQIEYSTDYTKAVIKIEITYDEELEEIQINGENIEIPEKTEGKYVIEKEITTNGTYNIYVKNKNDEYKIGKLESKEISEDLVITSVEELVAFRDKVNEGRTFEGRTITLAKSLNLSEITGESLGSWIPIGDYSVSQKSFKGTFDGAGNEIDGMYISSTSAYQGLFGSVEDGTIKNLSIGSNSVIKGASYTAAIASRIIGTIDCCYNKAKVSGGQYTGGLAGSSNCNITNSYNDGEISGTSYVGGITGWNGTSSKIENCANKKPISGSNNIGGICGINNSATTESCYNTGTVTSSLYAVGGIAGDNNYGTISYCYNLGAITSKRNYKWRI